jgi:hypothetical protein
MMGRHAHPKYPSMERQDLTPGQLGRFKFTPIDIVAPPKVDTSGNTALFWKAQERLRARISDQTRSLVTVGNQIDSSSLASERWLDQQLQEPAPLSPLPDTSSTFDNRLSLKPDVELFDHHIKPDLENSRLKLGTAAIRAAVNGTSPDKSFSQSRSRTEVSGHSCLPPAFLSAALY